MTNKAKYIPLCILLFAIVVTSVWATSPAGYVPAYNARSGYDDGVLRELLVEVKLIRGELRLMREQQSAAAIPSLSFKTVVTNRCAVCHGEEKYQEEGGGFMMLTKAGELEQFSAAQNRRIRREAVTTSRMPLNHPPLSLAEKAAVIKGTPLPEDK